MPDFDIDAQAALIAALPANAAIHDGRTQQVLVKGSDGRWYGHGAPTNGWTMPDLYQHLTVVHDPSATTSPDAEADTSSAALPFAADDLDRARTWTRAGGFVPTTKTEMIMSAHLERLSGHLSASTPTGVQHG